METRTPPLTVAFIGPFAVGKTSLSYYITYGAMPNSKPRSTNNFSDDSFKYSVGQEIKTITIRDTAGQERLRSLVPFYLRNVDGAAICFNPGAENYSIDSVQLYVELARNYDQNIPLIAIATRCDEWGSRLEIDTIQNSVRDQLGIHTFLVTSAHSGYGVKQLKEELANIKKVNTPTTELLAESSRFNCC
jgi:Ras-related protein Rab-6C